MTADPDAALPGDENPCADWYTRGWNEGHAAATASPGLDAAWEAAGDEAERMALREERARAASPGLDVERLPDRFVGFLVGEFMRYGFHRGPRAAQSDARGIIEDWNRQEAERVAALAADRETP